MSFTEKILPDEKERFERYAKEIREIQQRRAAGRPPRRALHSKQHVGARGELVVAGDATEALRVALFKDKKTWPVFVRYSNGSGGRQHDGAPDARAIAVKVVGVPGKKLIPGLEDKKTQDFLFINSPATPFRDPDEFVRFVHVSAKGGAPPLLVVRLFSAFGLRALSLLKSLASSPKVASMATSRFYTAAPIRFGQTAAKLALFPEATDGPRPTSDPGNALRDDLVARLKAGPVSYSVRVQLFVDDVTTPIEDSSAVWPEDKSAYVEVAKLVLPQQDVSSDDGKKTEELVESFSFDPWHAVEELRPLGAMMRARAVAYRESVIERKAAPEPE